MNETIKKRRAARVALGLKQIDVARLVGVSQSRYSRIEAGVVVPDQDLRQRISNTLASPVNELFSAGTVIPFPRRVDEVSQ